PVEPTRGGVKTLYPEYKSSVGGSSNAATLTVPASKSTVAIDKAVAAQSPRDGEVHVLPVQGNLYMLIADGVNVTVSLGNEGILLVNTGAAQMTEKVIAAIKQLGSTVIAPAVANTCAGANCPGAWGWASPYFSAVTSSPAPPRPLRYI